MKDKKGKNMSPCDPFITKTHINEAQKACDEYTQPVLLNTHGGLWKKFKTFKEHGVFDIIGTQLPFSNDTDNFLSADVWMQLAQAMRIYRDKRFETFRYIFVDKAGVIKDQVAVSSYLPNASRICNAETDMLERICAHAQETNTNIVIAHNHPSGNPTPSDYDIQVTEMLEQKMSVNGETLLKGHIILDHENFSLYKTGQGWDITDYTKKNKNVFTKDKHFPDIMLRNYDDMYNIGKKINDTNTWNERNWIPFLFINSDSTVIAIKYYNRDFCYQNIDDIKFELQNTALEIGATGAFSVIPDPLNCNKKLENQLKKMVENSSIVDFYINGKTAVNFHLNPEINLVKMNRETIDSRTLVQSTCKLNFSSGTTTHNIHSIAENYTIQSFYFNQNDFEKEIDRLSRRKSETGKYASSHIYLGMTPPIYQKIGFNNLPVMTTAIHIKTAMMKEGKNPNRHYHGISSETMKKIPEALKKPVMITQSFTHPLDIVSIISLTDDEKRPIFIPISYKKKGNFNSAEIDIHPAKSIYGRNDFKQFFIEVVKENKILYINKESQELVPPELQLLRNYKPQLLYYNINRYQEFVKQTYPDFAPNASIDKPHEKNDIFSICLQSKTTCKNFQERLQHICKDLGFSQRSVMKASQFLITIMPTEEKQIFDRITKKIGCTTPEKTKDILMKIAQGEKILIPETPVHHIENDYTYNR
jgi:hypothetical protein